VRPGRLAQVRVRTAFGTYLDLDPADGPYPLDEYGTSFAASQGSSALENGACPVAINGR
jgi:hypothetical protein